MEIKENNLEKYVRSIVGEDYGRLMNPSSLGEWDLILDEVAPDIFSWPLLHPSFCLRIIDEAERRGEWESNRHEHYPTNDMTLDKISDELNDDYNEILKKYVYPAAIHKWNLEGKNWKNLTFENFIIKYLPDQQSHLSLHHDHSKVTAIVSLNDNFSGGGTYFERQNFLLKNQVGHVTMHPGSITHRHGARPITSGVRYVLVTFSN